MSRGVPWSEDEDNLLRHLAQSGLGLRDIAIQMNKSASSIRGHAEKLKIGIASDRNEATKISRLVEIGLKTKK